MRFACIALLVALGTPALVAENLIESGGEGWRVIYEDRTVDRLIVGQGLQLHVVVPSGRESQNYDRGIRALPWGEPAV